MGKTLIQNPTYTPRSLCGRFECRAYVIDVVHSLACLFVLLSLSYGSLPLVFFMFTLLKMTIRYSYVHSVHAWYIVKIQLRYNKVYEHMQKKPFLMLVVPL